MRGRKPNTALKFLSGDRPVDPSVKPLGDPQPPAWLKEDAIKVWSELAPMLVELGIVGRIDSAPLARLCHLQAQYIAQTEEDPRTDLTRLGRDILQLEQAFGITPAARARVRLKPHAAKVTRSDDKSRFFSA